MRITKNDVLKEVFRFAAIAFLGTLASSIKDNPQEMHKKDPSLSIQQAIHIQNKHVYEMIGFIAASQLMAIGGDAVLSARRRRRLAEPAGPQ